VVATGQTSQTNLTQQSRSLLFEVSRLAGGIWHECDGPGRIRRLAGRPWRAVEAQHVISTRKLVDSDAEQQVLEEVLERSKPRFARLAELSRLHYLLSTPFRYPPLPHGSRFGSRTQMGIWYGSENQRTLFAEVAYYRLLFLEGTRALLPALLIELTAFRAAFATSKGIDLTRPPFSAHAPRISSKASYAATQKLGADMRAAGVEAFRWSSARDPQAGPNLGVFQPRAFTVTRPSALETWLCVATRQAVEISRKDFFRKQSFRFERNVLVVRGKLPSPAV